MDKLLALVLANPLQAVGIVALALCALLGTALYLMLVREFRRFETKLEAWEVRVGKLGDETRAALREHAEALGKATKAVNGDMLGVKESFLNLRQDLGQKLEEVRSFAGEIDRESMKTADRLAMVVGTVEEKVGRVIEIRAELELAKGRILVLDERTGRLREHVDQRFEKIARALLALAQESKVRNGR